MHVAYALEFLQSLSVQLAPEQCKDSHLCLWRYFVGKLQSLVKHLVWWCDFVYDSIIVSLFSSPLVRFQEHFARNLRTEFQPWQRADTVEMES